MKDILRSSPLLQMGWVVAFSVLVPLGVGLLLDRRFGTAPLFSIVGALAGILASTIGAVRVANRAISALERAAQDASAMTGGAMTGGATIDGATTAGGAARGEGDDDTADPNAPVVGGKED